MVNHLQGNSVLTLPSPVVEKFAREPSAMQRLSDCHCHYWYWWDQWVVEGWHDSPSLGEAENVAFGEYDYNITWPDGISQTRPCLPAKDDSGVPLFGSVECMSLLGMVD